MAENGSTHGFGTDSVNIGRSAVRNLSAATATLEQSAVQRLSAGSADLTNSAVGVVNGATIEVNESAIGVVSGDYVKVEDSRVFMLMGLRVNGNVHAVVTLQAAFAFGAGYFFARRLTSVLFGRRAAD